MATISIKSTTTTLIVNKQQLISILTSAGYEYTLEELKEFKKDKYSLIINCRPQIYFDDVKEKFESKEQFNKFIKSGKITRVIELSKKKTLHFNELTIKIDDHSMICKGKKLEMSDDLELNFDFEKFDEDQVVLTISIDFKLCN